MHGNAEYDRTATVFSPDGRLFQVEYARESVKRGTTALAMLFKDGVVLMAEKRISSRLVEPQYIEKLFKIDDSIGCTTSGLVADARILVEYAQMMAARHKIYYDEKMALEDLVKEICDLKQSYTQTDGVRPFGASLLIGGANDGEFRVYETDISGTPLGYKAGSIGAGKDAVLKFLEARYNAEASLEEAVAIGVEALAASVPEFSPNPDALEIGTITKKEKFKKMGREEIAAYLEKLPKQKEQKSDKQAEKQNDKKKA